MDDNTGSSGPVLHANLPDASSGGAALSKVRVSAVSPGQIEGNCTPDALAVVVVAMIAVGGLRTSSRCFGRLAIVATAFEVPRNDRLLFWPVCRPSRQTVIAIDDVNFWLEIVPFRWCVSNSASGAENALDRVEFPCGLH